RDRKVRVWDVASGKLDYVVDDAKGVTSEQTSRLLTFTASTSEPRVIFHVRDLEREPLIGEWTSTWDGGPLAVAHRATEIALARDDGTLALLDLVTGQQRGRVTFRGVVQRLAFDHDDTTLFAIDRAGGVHAWQYPSLAPRGELGLPAVSDAGLWSSPDHRYLVTGNFDSELVAWDLSRLQPGPTDHGHTGKVIGLATSADGQRLLTGSSDRTARIWDTATGRPTASFRHDAVVYFGVAFSPDGRLAATSDWDGVIQIWETDTARIQRTLRGHVSAITTLAFSPDGKLLASLAWGSIRPLIGWDLASGQPRYVREYHPRSMIDLAFSPDGRTLAVGDVGDRPLLIASATGREIGNRAASSTEGRMVAFGPDSRTLVTGGNSGLIERWDLARAEVRPLGQHRFAINGVTVSADGRWVGSASQDGSARVWDLATGEPAMTVEHHGFDANAICFLPDNRHFATAGDDNTVRLWDLQTRQPVWRARALLPRSGAPAELFTHRGWETLTEPPTPLSPEPAAWRTAIERARSTAAATGDGFLCLQLEDETLVMLDRRTDRVVTREPIAGVRAFIALPNACAFVDEKGAGLVDSSGAVTSLCPQASALGGRGSTLLVACGDRLRWFDAAGNEQLQRARPIGDDVTALATDEAWLLIGHRRGEIEIVPLAPGLSASSQALDQARPSAVTRLIVGPMHTVIAGQLDGSVSLWDLLSGALLERVALHGAVEHLLLDDKKLYAASELGDSETWDLSVLYLNRCELLQQVWSKVPSVWENGRSVLRAPVARRGCAPASATESASRH
ncbi:MAG: WD40 repeat domain-containing protein, partial [Deltaproteobacteria bacterium]|nr:WD40 repeat domain-containing protein [Deltaproteobacteria bacterium]